MSRPFSPRKLLLPLVPAYRLALWLREVRLRTKLKPVQRLRHPVVSIGNLSTGGVGKTPLTIALAGALTRRGFHVDVLSRGYGRNGHLCARVKPDGSAEDFGDEPLLIAREAGVPVYVADHRFDAGLLAEADAAAIAILTEETTPVVHLLDDGFQHRQLARDVDILLLDRQDWEDGLLPAGNLREPLKAARRAGAVAIPADDAGLEAELKAWGREGPAFDGPVIAFCGIGRPEQFFAGLEAGGLTIAERIVFADHRRFTARDVERLLGRAEASGAAALITTEKDLVRLGKLSSNFPEALPLRTAGLRVEIEDEDTAIEWVIARIGARIGDRFTRSG
jgi:tetraacyldisaccharide 4'-kinase